MAHDRWGAGVSVACDPILPEALWERLSPDAPLADHWTLLLLTVSTDGYPHQAMLSCGEVVASDRHDLTLAIWPESTAARNLDERPRATLTTVVDGTSWSLHVATTTAGEVVTPLARRLRRFRARIARVTYDRAPYALLTSGVTFQLNEPDATRQRWRGLRTVLAEEIG